MNSILYILLASAITLITTLITTFLTTLTNSKVQIKLIKLNNQNEIEREKIKSEEKRKAEKLKQKRIAFEKITEILLKIQNESTLTRNYMLEKEGSITKEKEKLYIEHHKILDELEIKGQLQITMYVPGLSDSFKAMRNYRNCAWGGQKDLFIEEKNEQRYQDGIKRYIENIAEINKLCEKMLYEIQEEAEKLAE